MLGNAMSFILKMAWRDSRRNVSRLFLFVAAIVVGIAALTAVRSFSINLTKDIDREAKTLLGADLLIEGNQALPDSLMTEIMAQPGVTGSRIYNLLSMLYFPRTQGTRLTMVRAISGDYPYYGNWNSAPADAWKNYRKGQKTLVEHALMLQFGLQTGDTVKIGKLNFQLEGDLLSRPGRAGVGSAIAPVAFIPMEYLDSTGLVTTGSRIWYQYYFKFPENTDVDAFAKTMDKALDRAKLNWETVSSNKKNIGAAFGSFSTFLNLVGFIALLLGCIGVAGAVHIYIKDKLPTVAILRCLGASGRKAFYVYLVQVSGIGLLGAFAGALLGSGIQKILPWLTKDLLPIETVSTDISGIAILQGTLLGLCVSVLFALLPLSGILKTSPLRTLRAGVDAEPENNAALRWSVYALIFAALLGFTRWLVGNWEQSLYFIGGIAVAFGVLYGIAWLLTFALRRYFPKKWPYVWRQGIANLFRPGNQTVLLIVTIGLGTMLLSILLLTQNLLLQQVEFTGRGQQPNMILFDIQSSEKDSVAALVRAKGMPLLQQVAIVTTRLETIDGRTKAQDEADSTKALEKWVWDREYRVTFRDTLIDTEKIIEGTWTGQYTPGQPIPISISDNLQKSMKASIGTKVVFNVQGARLETVVNSVRKVDFNRMQTNFLVVFPKGVLEQAPQFHVIISRVRDAAQSAAFQSELVRKYPSISAIDLTQVLKSLDEILGKVSFVIRFMALFSILTGLLVLLSSIYQGKYARIRESVLLRTLGARRSQILWINGIEYFLLGALACFAGIGLSVAGTWALAAFAFKIPFAPVLWPLLLIFGIITTLTVLIGLFNSREVLQKPPLEVLRATA
jgi:putative ABC transport system permease protein